MKLTRRELAAGLASSTAALAQPTPPPARAADAELKAARDRIRYNAQTLAKREIPMATEPAFQFKA